MGTKKVREDTAQGISERKIRTPFDMFTIYTYILHVLCITL